MNKQSLGQLTVEQLRQHKETLARRIDDLKFFNLDLGRENIRLAEEYRKTRDQADKVRQGKAPRLRRARNLTKSMYLQQQRLRQQSHIQKIHKPKSDSKSGGGFGLNDILKVGKSKLTGWWGGKGEGQRVNEGDVQGYYRHGVQHQQVVEQVVIVAECPPVEVIKEDPNVEKDPIQQPITDIIRQFPQISHQHHNQEQNYHRLYHHEQDYQRYIEQQQRRVYEQQQEYEQKVYHYDRVGGKQPVQKVEKKQVNRKNFEFDDLPGMGWRKLKGFMGFGSKKKSEHPPQGHNVNQQVIEQSRRREQYQQQSYQQANIPQQHSQQGYQRPVYYQSKNQAQINNPVDINCKRRTPIFGSNYLEKDTQLQVNEGELKQQREQMDGKEQCMNRQGEENNEEEEQNAVIQRETGEGQAPTEQGPCREQEHDMKQDNANSNQDSGL